MTKIIICNLNVIDEDDKFQTVELPLYLKNTFIAHFGLMETPTLIDFEVWLEETIAYSQIEKFKTWANQELDLPNTTKII